MKSIKIGTIYEICTRVRVTIDSENKLQLVFRRHRSLSTKQHHREVPYIKANPEDTAKRYYICSEYLIPLVVYKPYLESTAHMSDVEVLSATDDTLDDVGRMLSYNLGSESIQLSRYTPALRRNCLDNCILKLHSKGLNKVDIADLLSLGTSRVERVLRPDPEKNAGVVEETRETRVERASATHKGTRSTLVPKELKEAPEYAAIKKAANYARIKANKMGVSSTFLIPDVIPIMYDIQGNSGSHNNILVVPRVCPVLRLRLDYNVFEDNKAQNQVRVWRKTPGPDGKAPLSYDNVIVMSAAAAWAIEGAYATKKLGHLDDTSRKALAEWQAKYGTRTVPREAKIGRPRRAV